MVKRFITGIVLGTIVVVSGTVACSSVYQVDKVLSTNKSLTSKTKTTTQTRYATLEQSAHKQINQYRQKQGLPPLTLDSRISEVARAHSQAMANGKVPFSHEGFDQRVKAIGRVIPYRSSAENVAYNMGYSDPVTQAVQGWIKSPGHRENIEGQFNLTGIGVAKNAKGEYYFTQIFVRRRS